MAEQKVAAKQSGWAKFMHWYESYQGKHVVNIVYSAGASVVIVGALFKILHWPGASQVLMVGMFTESFLFIIGVLEKPHEEFHWGNVFPQLLEFGCPEDRFAAAQAQARPTLLGAGSEAGAVQPQAAARQGAGAQPLSESEMEALKSGISDLAKSAGQLSELGKLATTGTKLSEKLEAATEATEQFAKSASALGKKNDELTAAYSTIAADIQGAVDSTKNYSANVAQMSTRISSMNSIYELQLNTLQAQADAFKAQTAQVQAMTQGIEKMAATTAEAMKSSEAYEAGAKKLAGQIADLNKVYGNMLNALA